MNKVKKVVEPVKQEAEQPTAVEAPKQMSYEEKIARTKSQLDKEPKISYIIALGNGEKEGEVEVYTVNGYSYIIKKGERVNIPESIALALDERFRTLANLGKTAGVDGQDVRLEQAEARLRAS